MSIVERTAETDDKYTITIEAWAIVWVKAIAATIRASNVHISGCSTFEEQAGEILRDLLAAGWTAPNEPLAAALLARKEKE